MKREYDFSKARRGKQYKEVKIIKTIRLDTDILEWLEIAAKKEGIGYQTYLNWFLRKSMADETSIEARLIKLEKAVFAKRKRLEKADVKKR